MYSRLSARSIAALACSLLMLPFVSAQAAAQQDDDDDLINAPDHPLLQGFEWRSIGPTGQGGRVDDLALHPDDPYTNWEGENAPEGTTFQYYLLAPANDVAIRIDDPLSGQPLRVIDAPGSQGLNRVQWDLEYDEDDPTDDGGDPLEPGRYPVTLIVDGVEHDSALRVLEDVWMIMPER